MNIEKQVCSLVQAGKLKELGVTAPSQFRWVVYCPDPAGERYYYAVCHKDEPDGTVPGEYLGEAYTVAELNTILQIWTPYFINIWSEWGYKEIGGTPRGYQYQAEAGASRLIHLLENNKITAEDCNNRLNS